ncbi:MAG: class I SAM-dependent methyltransferase [Chthoniobacterales bacterium]
MPSALAGLNTVAQSAPVARKLPRVPRGDESLFEHFAWLYVFFRERLFRDDTRRIIHALWPNQNPPPTRLIELGCGPGFYSCSLAARLPALSVLGVDRSARQLEWAEKKARALELTNCHFESDDVFDLSHAENSFDVLIAARLFTVLPDHTRALAEMYRVLRPGGRCLIAEPRYAFWASLPLFTMWLLASLTRMNNGYCEPRRATVFSPADFRKLFASQSWREVRTWQDGRYQYALCEKV